MHLMFGLLVSWELRVSILTDRPSGRPKQDKSIQQRINNMNVRKIFLTSALLIGMKGSETKEKRFFFLIWIFSSSFFCKKKKMNNTYFSRENQLSENKILLYNNRHVDLSSCNNTNRKNFMVSWNSFKKRVP
jgi:hypothetical protein